MTLRDWEEMPEEEFDKIFDATMRELLRQVKEEEKNKPTPVMRVINPKVVQDVTFVCNAMKELTKGTDAKVTFGFNDAFNTAWVDVRARNFVVNNPIVFLVAASKIPGLEADTSTDGTVDICFTRHNLMIEYDESGNEIK